MKKIAVIALSLCFSSAFSQSAWDINLNNINPPDNPNFGTANNNPINFFTNGAQKMSLSPTGVLQINGLAGSGSRFLQTDASGNIVPWTGTSQYLNSILFGDGTWRPNLIMVDGNRMSIPSGAKFGLGISNPAVAIDVSGDMAATGTVKATGGFKFNSLDGLTYDPTNNILSFGKGSSFPQPAVDACSSLPALTAQGWFNAGGLVSSQVNPTSAPNVNAALRMYVSPSSGNGFMELNGIDANNTTNNALFINYNCGRNTNINTGLNSGIVRIGSSNAASQVFIGDFVNMSKHLEIGDATAGILSSPTNVALDIHTHSGTGIRFRTNTDNIPLISIEDRSNSVLKNTFTVLGDGATSIITENMNAFEIKDANALNTGFKVYNYGTAVISPSGAYGLIVQDPATASGRFVVNSNGYTEIKTTNTKALSVYNGNNETISFSKDGYSEIKVYSPLGMPNNRVIAVKDMSASRDLFVVKSDGKVYAREVEISLATTFPDYVFSTEYKLMPINKVEDFIAKNKHLPGFEKGTHYERNGINVNDMFIKQQEKIEELMLYVIELEKRLKAIEN